MENPSEFFTQEVLEQINNYIHDEFSYGGDYQEDPLEDLHEDIKQE